METILIRPTAAGGPWLTIDEAAKRAGYSTQTFKNMRAMKTKGRPRGTRLGRRIWYTESEVDQWVARRREKA